MTSKQFKDWLYKLNMNRKEFAEYTELSVRTVRAYTTGELQIPKLVQIAILYLYDVEKQGI